MISSPPEFAVRPARPEDAEAVLRLVPPELGFGLDDIYAEWRTTDLERDTWAWEHDGRPALEEAASESEAHALEDTTLSDAYLTAFKAAVAKRLR